MRSRVRTSVSVRFLRIALAGASFAGTSMPVAAQQAVQSMQPVTVDVSIPAGPLEGALLALGRQTDLRLVYASAITSGKRSPGARGTLTSNEALAQILAGTDIPYSISGRTVTLGVDTATAPDGAAADGSTMLDPITVRGGRVGRPADEPFETAGSSSYISGEQIERFRGSTTGDVFKNAPGVISAGNRNGDSVNINIRGLQGQNRIRVSVDGTQQSTTTWRGYQGVDERTYIDPDLIGGVSISKGPSGGAEGAGAIGGVVSLRTINADDLVEDGKEYGVRLRAGTQNKTTRGVQINALDQRTDPAGLFDLENGSGSIAAATKQENFDLVVAVARRERDNYYAGKNGPTTYRFDGRDWPLSLTQPGEEVFNTSSESWSFLTKGTIRWGDAHSLELGYIHYDSTFGEAMPSLLFTQPQTHRQAALSSATTDTFTSRYRWNPDDRTDLRFNMWMSHVEQTSISTGLAVYFPPWVTPEIRPPADDPRYATTRTYGTDISNSSIFDTDHGTVSVNYGASYLLEDIAGKPYRSRGYANDIGVLMQPSVGTREIASLFSTGEWIATDWLKFNAGLRYDRYALEDKGEKSSTGIREKEGGALSPSISATITPADGLQFYALYSEGMRPPTMRETMGSDANSIPNPGLEPEFSRNWEVGLNYSVDGLFTDDDQARLKFSYFNNSYDSYISRVASNAGPGQPVFTFDNLDRARFKGLELSGSYEAGPFFSQASLTYYTSMEFCLYANDCGSVPVNLDYAANHMPPKIMGSLTMGMKLFEDRFTVGARVTHAGERLSELTTSARQYTGYWRPYTVVDAFATYKINDTLTLDMQAENLFDRFYIDALDGWNPSPGRTVRAVLTAKF